MQFYTRRFSHTLLTITRNQCGLTKGFIVAYLTSRIHIPIHMELYTYPSKISITYSAYLRFHQMIYVQYTLNVKKYSFKSTENNNETNKVQVFKC